ncbi:MAG: SAM-dependent methyltransferase [Hyphomicrobiaceae bacterium]|jgi:SAM-dependent methyltransferase
MLTIDPEILSLAPGSRVLDLGCGEGRHLRALRTFPGLDTFGLDLGEWEVETTAKSLGEMDDIAPEAGGASTDAGTWGVVRGSGYELPFADAAFDCVIFSEVLEHLHEEDRVLDEVHRVLRPGGLLALSVPREGPEAVCWALSHEYRNTPGGHLRIYRREQLRSKLEAHGYRVFDSHFAHALHAPYWWTKCLFGVGNEDILPVRLYRDFLEWDLMSRPWITHQLEQLLNPVIGKSVVFYAIRG